MENGISIYVSGVYPGATDVYQSRDCSVTCTLPGGVKVHGDTTCVFRDDQWTVYGAEPGHWVTQDLLDRLDNSQLHSLASAVEEACEEKGPYGSLVGEED